MLLRIFLQSAAGKHLYLLKKNMGHVCANIYVLESTARWVGRQAGTAPHVQAHQPILHALKLGLGHACRREGNLLLRLEADLFCILHGGHERQKLPRACNARGVYGGRSCALLLLLEPLLREIPAESCARARVCVRVCVCVCRVCRVCVCLSVCLCVAFFFQSPSRMIGLTAAPLDASRCDQAQATAAPQQAGAAERSVRAQESFAYTQAQTHRHRRTGTDAQAQTHRRTIMHKRQRLSDRVEAAMTLKVRKQQQHQPFF